MNDLISRQAAIDEICKACSCGDDYINCLDRRPESDFCDELVALRGVPSAQPERKKGRWEQVEVNYFADMDAEIQESMVIASMFCPRCKRYHNEVYLYGSATYLVNFCPNCGADMREGQP